MMPFEKSRSDDLKLIFPILEELALLAGYSFQVFENLRIIVSMEEKKQNHIAKKIIFSDIILVYLSWL